MKGLVGGREKSGTAGAFGTCGATPAMQKGAPPDGLPRPLVECRSATALWMLHFPPECPQCRGGGGDVVRSVCAGGRGNSFGKIGWLRFSRRGYRRWGVEGATKYTTAVDGIERATIEADSPAGCHKKALGDCLASGQMGSVDVSHEGLKG